MTCRDMTMPPQNASTTCIRNAVIASLEDTRTLSKYEGVACKLSFSDTRFALFPVSCVVSNVVKTQPAIKADLSDLQFDNCVFIVLQSVLAFRKKMKDIEIPVAKARALSSIFEEKIVTPFSGFIVQRDLYGRFIRQRSTRIPDEPVNKRKHVDSEVASTYELFMDLRSTVTKLEKELKETNKNYAATVEENDALSDELETANSNIRALTRNNDRERKSIKTQLIQYEETIALLQVRSEVVMFSRIVTFSFFAFDLHFLRSLR